jgi:hypothetical protein
VEASSSEPIAIQKGAMKISSMKVVITAVASDRRPPSRRCTRKSSGQVATTIAVAQTSEATKGRIVHRLAARSTPMIRTMRVMRVMSGEFGRVMGPLHCRATLGERADAVKPSSRRAS